MGGGQLSIRDSIYHRWKLTMRSIYHEVQNNIWPRPYIPFIIHTKLGYIELAYASCCYTIRLYGYMDTNTINKGKRNEIIQIIYWKKYINRKLKKGAVIPFHKCLCFKDRIIWSILLYRNSIHDKILFLMGSPSDYFCKHQW